MTDSSTSDLMGAPPDAEETPKDLGAEVQLWQERVSLAKRDLDDWAKTSGADRFVQEYNGKFELFFNGLKGNIPVPPTGEVFAYVQADVANTYNRDPYISVNPKAGTVKGAKIWEAILNYDWRRLRTKEEVELEIIDKDLVGDGWHKVGFEVESEGAEEELKIIKSGLYSARVDWKDIVWNFGAKRIPHDCLWMAQRVVKPIKYIQQKYKNARGRWPLKGVPNPEVSRDAYEKSLNKDDISVGVIWEIWDKETRQIFLIAEGLNKKYLADPRPWPEYMDEFPFIPYWDFWVPGKARHMSAIAPWEPAILETMVLLAAAVNHHKRWNRQMLVKKGAISDGDLDKIERGNDGAIVDYNGTGKLDENLKMLDWGAMPTDYYLLMDRLNAVKRDTSGQPEFERGGVTKTSTRTEGELQLIAQGAKGRLDRRIDRFETHLENIARHMMKHRKANFDFDETVWITGEAPEDLIAALGNHYNPVTRAVKFSPRDIEGDYEVEIKAGSTLPLNREGKIQILENVMNALVQVSQVGPSPTLRTVIGEMLNEFDIKVLQEAFAQEEQAIQESQKAEQDQAASQQIKDRSQAAKNVAQADKVGAEADKLHLENAAKHVVAHTQGVETLAELPAPPGGMGEGGAPQ